MNSLPQSRQPLLLIPVDWINHQEQDVVEHFRTDDRMLREKLGKKRIRLNDDQRQRLAVKGGILGGGGDSSLLHYQSGDVCIMLTRYLKLKSRSIPVNESVEAERQISFLRTALRTDIQ